MPANLYGPGDNYDLHNSHVLPALIRKFHEAEVDSAKRPVVLWGTGSPYREFLHVDDLADACVFLMEGYSGSEIVNIGAGSDIMIRELAGMVQRAVGYDSEVIWDTTKPDGTPRKLLDVSRLKGLGWSAKIGLEEGIRATYDWYFKNHP